MRKKFPQNFNLRGIKTLVLFGKSLRQGKGNILIPFKKLQLKVYVQANKDESLKNEALSYFFQMEERNYKKKLYVFLMYFEFF